MERFEREGDTMLRRVVSATAWIFGVVLMLTGLTSLGISDHDVWFVAGVVEFVAGLGLMMWSFWI
jgi:hypothetical protein